MKQKIKITFDFVINDLDVKDYPSAKVEEIAKIDINTIKDDVFNFLADTKHEMKININYFDDDGNWIHRIIAHD